MMADIILVPYVIQVRHLTNFHGRVSQMVINQLGLGDFKSHIRVRLCWGGGGNHDCEALTCVYLNK